MATWQLEHSGEETSLFHIFQRAAAVLSLCLMLSEKGGGVQGRCLGTMAAKGGSQHRNAPRLPLTPPATSTRDSRALMCGFHSRELSLRQYRSREQLPYVDRSLFQVSSRFCRRLYRTPMTALPSWARRQAPNGEVASQH